MRWQLLLHAGRAALRLAADHVLEALGLAGFASIVTGLWWIYPPAALIAGGGGTLVFSFWATRCLQRLSWLKQQAQQEAR